MNRIPLLCSALLIASSFAAPAAAEEIHARLAGLHEVPTVSTGASGLFKAVINRNGDAIDYEITYTGIQGTVTQSHMHVGQARTNGGIVLWICGTTSNPGPAGTPTCTSPDGHISGTWTAENVQLVATQQFAPGDLNEVIAAIRAGAAYVNVHSTLSPGGEIRGQVRSSRRGHDHDHDDHGHDHH
jgi:hypothetical protein